VLLGNTPVLAPDETFYQRLLANDPEEATEQAEEYVKGRALGEFFDEVAIPALLRAQIDSDEGVLPPERRMMIRQGIRAMLEGLSEDVADEGLQHAERREIWDIPGIVCVAGRNELDEAAAALLVHLLRSEHSVRVGDALHGEALASENPCEWVFEQASLVCLSLISTTSPARARYLVRRLRRRAPRAKVLIGFWSLAPSELPVTVAAIAGPDIIVATTLRDAATDLKSNLSPTASHQAALGGG
jgi:hypothetical protein